MVEFKAENILHTKQNKTKCVDASLVAVWVATRVYLLAEGAAAVAATVSVETRELGGSFA
jgi:hypothetical protein